MKRPWVEQDLPASELHETVTLTPSCMTDPQQVSMCFASELLICFFFSVVYGINKA